MTDFFIIIRNTNTNRSGQEIPKFVPLFSFLGWHLCVNLPSSEHNTLLQELENYVDNAT